MISRSKLKKLEQDPQFRRKYRKQEYFIRPQSKANNVKILKTQTGDIDLRATLMKKGNKYYVSTMKGYNVMELRGFYKRKNAENHFNKIVEEF